ncbi:hypothetical protein [Jeotgalibacillus proteolyticus]|uniref:Uncharacterized protein n=1 Tax=Jeotgalibacillus proteolyticus TaxID=2082395 RepID=A0A2S5G8X2_9BACL|nr:hypothetical protein [Jeotgalibacillus proteolyticus]PPA69452.1 hypothetical protein C4B60_16880 [Jeotgalibacillus proteolyticus]
MNSFEHEAKLATDLIYEREPSLMERFGEKGKRKCYEDNIHHFKQLQSAYALQQAAFFTDYALWLNGILSKHGMNEQHLIDNFQIIHQVINETDTLDADTVKTYEVYLNEAIGALQSQAVKGAD